MNRKFAAVMLSACLVTSCAPRIMPAFAKPIPDVGKIDRFFIVFVQPDANLNTPGGCKVDVYPKGPSRPDADSVKVKHNWRVAWFVVNTCQTGVTPTIDFYLKSDQKKTTKKSPVEFTDRNPSFLIGKVKNKPKDCNDMEEDAPCTTFNYTIHFGDAFEDPEIEIVM